VSVRRLLLLGLALCGCDGRQAVHKRPDAGHTEVRTVKPPRDHQGVHVYPPHAIRPDGVGPYVLDAPLNEMMHIAPEGPRLQQLELGDLLSWQVEPAEQNRLLIGADEHSRKVAFIVVLAAEVARTENGMTVGMSGAALKAAFGPPREERDLVRTRKVYEFEKLPNVQFLTNDPPDRPDDETRVVAVLVSRPPAPAPTPTPTKAPGSGRGSSRPVSGAAAAQAAREAARAVPCRSGGALRAVPLADLWAAAHPGRAKPGAEPVVPHVAWACISSEDPEALLWTSDELAVVGGAPGKLKKIWAVSIGAADQVGPLDVDGDGRDEVVALQLQRGEDDLALSLRAWQWERERLVPLASQRLFQVTREVASTAGVRPSGIELWPEVRPGPGALVVGGLYAERTMAGVRTVAPLLPVRVRLEPRGGRPAPPDAGTPERPDAGTARPGRAHDAGAAAPENEAGKDSP
jgi:hypothetical protein